MTLVIGSDRFWCPETVNFVAGVCAELVVAAGHARMFVWRMPGGEPIATWPRHRELAGAQAVALVGDDVVFDVGDRRVAVALATGALRTIGQAPPAARASRDDRVITIVAPDGTSRTVVREGLFRQPAVTPDGRRLAIRYFDRVEVIDVSGEVPVWSARRVADPVLSADGRWLALADLGRQRIEVVDLDEGRVITPAEPTLPPPQVATTSELVIARLAGGAGVWTLDGGAWLRSLPVGTLAVRQDDVLGMTTDGVGRWDPRTGERRAFVALPGRLQCGGFDGAGRRFAAALHQSGGLMAWGLPGVWVVDLEAGTAEVIDLEESLFRSVAISPDGERVVTCDDELRIHAVAPGFPVVARSRGANQATLLFSPDGARLLVIPWDAEDGEPRIVDVATGAARPAAIRKHLVQWTDAGWLIVDEEQVLVVDPERLAVRASWTFDARVSAAGLHGDRLAVATHRGFIYVRRVPST